VDGHPNIEDIRKLINRHGYLILARFWRVETWACRKSRKKWYFKVGAIYMEGTTTTITECLRTVQIPAYKYKITKGLA
jgi:hypothetical protein